MTVEYEYQAANVRCIDGDTIECDVLLGMLEGDIASSDLGFGIRFDDEGRLWKRETFRLFGINTPELRGDEKVAGYDAKRFLKEFIEASDETKIKTIKDKQGKYGRYLAIVFCTADGDQFNMNEELVNLGHAVYHDY